MPDRMENNCLLSVCSNNCRLLKHNEMTVHNLCSMYDIIILHEHWLMPHKLCMLNSVHNDFDGIGQSAIDTSHDLVAGRPYGGTAILSKKHLATNISSVVTNNSRITGIHVSMSSGKLLLLNIYMPCNYGDDEGMIEYMECLGDLNAVMIESDAVNTVIAGDFNCNTESKFFPLLDSFLQENGLIMSDMLKLSHVDTYVSDDGLRCSWIDHILCSQSLVSVVSDVTVLSHVIATDHRPLVFNADNILH